MVSGAGTFLEISVSASVPEVSGSESSACRFSLFDLCRLARALRLILFCHLIKDLHKFLTGNGFLFDTGYSAILIQCLHDAPSEDRFASS